MHDRVFKILLIQEVVDDPEALNTLLPAADHTHQIRHACGLKDALPLLTAEEFDLALLDVSPDHDQGLQTLAQVREHVPALPIIVMTSGHDEPFALRALRAGAQDCLDRGQSLQPVLARAVSYAIERNRFLAEVDEARSRDAQDREFGGLTAICGPAPMPITERSFGLKAVKERSPAEYEALVQS
jgi:DNA-binding NarL/FixJ family response regulator